RLLAVVGEAEVGARALPAQRPRHVGCVVDVEVDEALRVEPEDVAAVGLAIEPAEERGAQAGVEDLAALVKEAPLRIEPDPGAAEARDLVVAELHLNPGAAARAIRSG